MVFFKKSDLKIILIIIIISIVTWLTYIFLFSNKPAKAEIYYYSTLVKTIDLNTGVDQVFSISQNKHVVFHLYKDGNIRFEESNCPDKVCINAGKLHMIGESSACLPNGIVLKIVPNGNRKDDDIDIIVS